MIRKTLHEALSAELPALDTDECNLQRIIALIDIGILAKGIAEIVEAIRATLYADRKFCCVENKLLAFNGLPFIDFDNV